jgi:two-component system, sensor histidine kinase and response regulator
MIPAVLAVDDRPENLEQLQRALGSLDVRLVPATSGDAALKWLFDNECAVVLLGVSVDLDGYRTARAIKGEDRTRHVPIIFLTARSNGVDDQLEGYGIGAVDFLANPFDPVILRSKVNVLAELFVQAKVIEQQNRQLREQLGRLRETEAALTRQTNELERSNAELERFAFVASHDLREPLLVVGGLLELLGDDVPPDAAAELRTRASAGVNNLAGMVDDILSYARASTGELLLEEVALDDLVASVIADVDGVSSVTGVAGADGADGATTVTISSDPLPTVVGDRWQLARLFHHLLDNAVKFRRHDTIKPEVHIGLARSGGDWVLSVQDNGIGIAPEDMDQLFTLFRPPASSSDDHGPSVGLAVCRRVVERHGGTIRADSVPGRGTTISFTLPVGEQKR